MLKTGRGPVIRMFIRWISGVCTISGRSLTTGR
jgi:hypothetical protein